MPFGMYSPASTASFTGSPEGLQTQANAFPEATGAQSAPLACPFAGTEDLSSLIKQLTHPAYAQLTPIEQLQHTPAQMSNVQYQAVDSYGCRPNNMGFGSEAFGNQTGAPYTSDIMSSLSMLSAPFGSGTLDAGAFLSAQATPPAPFPAWDMAPSATPTSTGNCADFQSAHNGPAGSSISSSSSHQTLAQPPAVAHYPPLFCLGGAAAAANTTATTNTTTTTANATTAATATATAAGSHGAICRPPSFAVPSNVASTTVAHPHLFAALAAADSRPVLPTSFDNSGFGHAVLTANDRQASRARSSSSSSSASWKNQPRNSISKRQKLVFYRWLLENERFPFPNDDERLGHLAVDAMTEKQFKYWFANIRCRQFIKHRSSTGEFFFTPNAKFYESCLRLRIDIPGSIPVDIRRAMRRPRRPSKCSPQA
ncbi:hypothetical protein IWW48_002144 [Coemansia sp. RSA 1200]|nr:hypothetical protein IWW48_002144 [Coemansia sp. RSA 1200]